MESEENQQLKLNEWGLTLGEIFVPKTQELPNTQVEEVTTIPETKIYTDTNCENDDNNFEEQQLDFEEQQVDFESFESELVVPRPQQQLPTIEIYESEHLVHPDEKGSYKTFISISIQNYWIYTSLV